MRPIPVVGALLAALLVASEAPAAEYGYPIRDPYLATVIGTARADQAVLPASVPERIRQFVYHAGRCQNPSQCGTRMGSRWSGNSRSSFPSRRNCCLLPRDRIGS